jgi:hypothetical protein
MMLNEMRDRTAPSGAGTVINILRDLPLPTSEVSACVLPMLANHGMLNFRSALFPWLADLALGDATFGLSIVEAIVLKFPVLQRGARLALIP